MAESGGSGRPALPAGGIWWLVLVVVLGSWLVVPVALRGSVQQDLVPYLVAGEFVGVHDDAIYVPGERSFAELDPRFRARACELLGPDVPCDGVAVPSVSPPVILPLVAGWARLGQEPAALLVRLLGAACFVGGMAVLWRDLAGRSRRAPAAVALTAVALTPFVVSTLAIGQTSPLLFAGALLAPPRWRRPAAVGGATAVWVLAAGFKVFPVLLVGLVLYRRWWKVLAWAGAIAALLTVWTLALVPLSVFGDYLRAAAAVSRTVVEVPYDVSVQALVHTAWPGAPRAVDLALLVALLGGVVALWWRRVRHAGPATEWAFLWYGAMIAMPLVWWHYASVLLAALGTALVHRRDLDRVVLLLPVAALVISVLGEVNDPSLGWRLAVVAFLFAGLVVAARLVPAAARPAPAGLAPDRSTAA